MKFIHQFRPGLTCSIEVEEPPGDGLPVVLAIHWTGTPESSDAEEYKRWSLLTHQFLSNHWGLDCNFLLGMPEGKTERWHFAPGAAPELLETLSYELC